MDDKSTMDKLEKLYDIAIENKDAIAGLEIVNAMMRAGAAEVESKREQSGN